MSVAVPWRIWVDTGGTFTDCLAIDQDGVQHRAKVLSTAALRLVVEDRIGQRVVRLGCQPGLPVGFFNGFVAKRLDGGDPLPDITGFEPGDCLLDFADDLPSDLKIGESLSLISPEEAPILAARMVTGTSSGQPLPSIEMRLATTRATNALLERKGGRVAFFVTRGFADLLLIGDQTRPDLFAINIRKPDPLFEHVEEVDERLDARGAVHRPLDGKALRLAAIRALGSGCRVAAISLLHSYANPEHEERAGIILTEAGFDHVFTSASLAPLIRVVPRAETCVVNAYTSPVVDAYLRSVEESIGSGRLQTMTSAGSLVPATRVHAKDCLLSGPAGGVLGAAGVGELSGYPNVIGFDMGGTSTDVCRIDGAPRYLFEHRVGDAHIMAPSLAIETVAAGGGSICTWCHGHLRVGPESAGAEPGPACYGAGGPLTLTDVNLLLGHLKADGFGIPIDIRAAERAFEHLLNETRLDRCEQVNRNTILRGLLAIADERMADAIRRVSVRDGVDPAGYAIVSFGGAGGQHACRVAEHLGITTVIMPHDASILSAVGLGRARREWMVERQVLRSLGESPEWFRQATGEMIEEATHMLSVDGLDRTATETTKRVIVNARLPGQDTSLSVEAVDAAQIKPCFESQFHARYGYPPDSGPIEIESIRVLVSTGEPAMVVASLEEGERPAITDRQSRGEHGPAHIDRDDLNTRSKVTGPAIVFSQNSTFLVPEAWSGTLDEHGSLILTRTARGDEAWRHQSEGSELIEFELFTNRLTAIAFEMGELLERTALSTNVKERRDFSCALLDAEGRLLVNAPHMPVHLGALGLCVRSVSHVIEMKPGDVIITNHPAYGGSHLPDITLITPVFDDGGMELVGFAVNRAHHAEVGGTRPGSMPPDATTLVEEGVVIPPTHLVQGGASRFDEIEARLRGGNYPSRSVAENLADLRAGVAANRHGVLALQRLARTMGTRRLRLSMQQVHDSAAMLMSRAVSQLEESVFEARDEMDDGWPVCVRIERCEDRLSIDFTGSGEQHPGNLNATPAIVHSAVLYVLRLLLGEACPLNEGIMDRVEVVVPPGFLNPTFCDDPEACPAVVGGNVETSQRVVDVLLRAFSICAASQGTMNNTLFGNDQFAYYETVCGGAGATVQSPGADAVHTHMTNSRLTDPEVLEHRYPVRLERFAIRRGSGGQGEHRGGDGVTREMTFLEALDLSVLTQRRTRRPFGLRGGGPGQAGRQLVVRGSGKTLRLASVDARHVAPGDRLIVETPGGGGFGQPTG